MTPGTIFRHARLLDPDWTPGPGERYADAPHAVCRVTATRGGRVYYRLGTEPGPGQRYFHASDTGTHVMEILDPRQPPNVLP